MSNHFDTMRAALQEASEINRAADDYAHKMAMMLEGRLRHVSSYTLARLKRELRDFNIHTKEWKK